MATLHILNKLSVISLCQPFLNPTDSIVFIEEGVLAVLMASLPFDAHPVYFLDEDIQMRGLLISGRTHLNLINYTQLVDLTVQYDAIHCWY